MPTDSENKDVFGQERQQSGSSAFNELDFVINQQLAKLATAMPARVVAVRGGGLDVVGFVDIEPMVQQLTGDNKPIAHGTLTNVPYFRLQGGANAIIIDPVVGDIGIAVFSSRDITTIKKTRKTGAPGSFRRYSMSDAMYIGGILNAAPQQYIQFTGNSIAITALSVLTLAAPAVEITGVLTNNGVNVGSTHTHSGVEPGGGSTGGPH